MPAIVEAVKAYDTLGEIKPSDEGRSASIKETVQWCARTVRAGDDVDEYVSSGHAREP